MSRYLQWNDALARHFFRPEAADQPVYLYATPDVVSEVGRPFGGAPQDFVEAVKQGPPWTTRQGLCQTALQACEGWRDRGLEYPPYLAYLCLFVLAAGHEGDFAPHAYYPQLWMLLGSNDSRMPPSFERMLELWDDLEKWSVHDKRGEWGVFEAQIYGGWIHVGLPVGQTLLTENDRKGLRTVFARSGFDPTSPPSDEELVREIRREGSGLIGGRTLRLLEETDDDRRSALLDALVEELSQWKGEVPFHEPSQKHLRFLGNLRLCMKWDPVSRRLEAYARCRMNTSFPQERLTFLAANISDSSLWCDDFASGWSTRIREISTDRVFDGSQLNWISGTSLEEARGEWRFSMKGLPVRILMEGEDVGLPDLIEVYQVPHDRPFLLLYHESFWQRMEKWVRRDCEGFRTQEVLQGLPKGWCLGSVERVRTDSYSPKEVPSLSLQSRVRFRFVNGIRSSGGNNFFAFALPEILLEGGRGDEEVLCNGDRLMAFKPNRFALPDALPRESRIEVEIRRRDKLLRRRSLYLTGDFSWTWKEPRASFDKWGSLVKEEGMKLWISGAVVKGTAPAMGSFGYQWQLALPTKKSRRVMLIGPRPGQISAWPGESAPTWSTIWVVPIGKRGQVFYCGQDLDASQPQRDRLGGSIREIAHWKKVLWYWRKRIRQPEQRILRQLWRQYQEAARNV